jgi:hypothetical protein
MTKAAGCEALERLRGGEGLAEETGTVVLASIPIRPQPAESFDVERDQLIAEEMKTMACIGAKEIMPIESFVAALKEPDER